MIGTLCGKIIKQSPPRLLIEVNGVGYEIDAPMSTFYQLPLEAPNATTLLYTHYAIREDAHQLYGFICEADRDLFRVLIKANGVGPKLALSILSGMEPEPLMRAIMENNTAQLTKIPGVGLKTAQRLCIECASAIQKLREIFALNQQPGQAAIIWDNTTEDAIDALISLGYKPQQAKAAIEKIQKTEEHSTEKKNTPEIIRLALQQMMSK